MKIIQITSQVLPGKMAGTLDITVFGLGDDGILYVWNGKEKKWIPA